MLINKAYDLYNSGNYFASSDCFYSLSSYIGFRSIQANLSILQNKIISQKYVKYKHNSQIEIELLYVSNIKICRCIHGISIIIPVYNGEQYIRRCIESILRQTLEKQLYEVVVVINGKMDRTLEIIKEMTQHTEVEIKVIYIHEKNLSIARNVGLDYAFKEFFCFVDVDDYIEKKYLQECLKIASNDNVVLTNIKNIENGCIQSGGSYSEVLERNKHCLDIINAHNFFSLNACKIVPKHFIVNMKFDESLKSGEDVVFWTKFLAKNKVKIVSTFGSTNSDYVREITADSVSRKTESFKFNVIQRLEVIKLLKHIVCEEKEIINIINSKIKSQLEFVMRYIISHQNDFKKFIYHSLLINNDIELINYVAERTNSIFSASEYASNIVNYFVKNIKYIRENSKKLFDFNSISKKKTILSKIDSCTEKMLNIYTSLPESKKLIILDLISKNNIEFLNSSKFSIVKGFAFCHNFSPSGDASAYVAAKRLSQVSTLFGKPINWTVFRAHMQSRPQDLTFNNFFARYQCSNIYTIGSQTYWNEASQLEWGLKAFDTAKGISADIIYSRSMWAGSHVAALYYKMFNPNVKWYAEFSDPIYMDANNNIRKSTKIYTGAYEYLNNFWCDLESKVCSTADFLIFTNKNQRDYMLKMNPSVNNQDKIVKKSYILAHPILSEKYTNLVHSDYNIDKSVINIAYFGSVYANRACKTLFELAHKYEFIRLHLFVPNGKIEYIENYDKNKIIINDFVEYFEFLNIASKMDYLYLEDIDFKYDINPYLPSKLADYLSSGTYILAKIFPNSPLSLINSHKIINLNTFYNEYNKRFCIKI